MARELADERFNSWSPRRDPVSELREELADLDPPAHGIASFERAKGYDRLLKDRRRAARRMEGS